MRRLPIKLVATILSLAVVAGVFLLAHGKMQPVAPCREQPSTLQAPAPPPLKIQPADWSAIKVAPLTRSEYRALRRHLNKEHLRAAEVQGFQRVADEKVLQERLAHGGLVRLSSGNRFVPWKLEDSRLYLTPSAARLLNDVGERFQNELTGLGLPPLSLCLNSVLRTTGSQRRLRRRNVNATSTSSHEYGTTFDVSYTRFFPPSSVSSHDLPGQPPPQEDAVDPLVARKLKAILARVILKLQAEGRCLVIYERNQLVFHVTARGEGRARAKVDPEQTRPAPRPAHRQSNHPTSKTARSRSTPNR